MEEVGPDVRNLSKGDRVVICSTIGCGYCDAPGQVFQWAVKAVAKAGRISIIGVYPETQKTFPIGAALNKNLGIDMGNCNHRKYVPPA